VTVDKDLNQCLSGKCNSIAGIDWEEDESTNEMLASYPWYTEKPTERLMELREKREKATTAKCLIALLKEFRIDCDGDLEERREFLLATIDRWIAEQPKNLLDDTGLTPSQFLAMQSIMGDNVDSIQGAVGIGKKIATDLILHFGTPEKAIEAAKDDTDFITAKKRQAMIEFEPKLEITRQLVTLVTSLDLPRNTRI
jgi:5'-3' exonuclease